MAGKRRFLTKGTLALGALIAVAAVAAVQLGLIPGLASARQGAAAPAPTGSTPVAGAAPDAKVVSQQEQLIQQEADLRTRETSLKQKETQVADTLKALSLQQTNGDALHRVVDMYAAMPPYKAAPIIEALGQEQAVAILRLLDQEQAGAILARMEPARGSQLTVQLMKPQTETQTQAPTQTPTPTQPKP